MCTSLQSIVNVYDRTRLQKDIQDLFKPKLYPRFELQEFYQHQLYEKNEQFHFFMDILEEWNRKIEQNEVPNHCQTLYKKNTFIFNSLRNALMQPLNLSSKILSHLYHWFNTTRNKNIRPVVKKSQTFDNENDDWFVRNTFKSNLPAEIDLYRRRVCCRQRDNQEPETVVAEPAKEEQKVRKVKTECWTKDTYDKDLQKKRVVQIQNQINRMQRERHELLDVQTKWKKKKYKEKEVGIKNFYRGTFSANKTYFAKKKSTEENHQAFRQYSLKRVKTSMSQRFSKRQSKVNRLSQGDPNLKRFSQNFMDEVEITEQNGPKDVTGLRLLINPFETKLKKKKRTR